MKRKRNFRRHREKDRRRANLVVVALVSAAVLIVGALIWNSLGRAALGEAFPTSGTGSHVPDGSPLPRFSSDPPTSGPHYVSPLPEGFYAEDSREATSLLNPQGYIVHSMEHGYVIFWYNCAVVEPEACDALVNGLLDVLQEFDSYKIIAFPWTSTDVPVVATSWGRSLSMAAWDADLAGQFIRRNRNKSPEPFAR